MAEEDIRHNGTGLEKQKVSDSCSVAEVCSLPSGERSRGLLQGTGFPPQVIEQHIEDVYVTQWIYAQIKL